MGSLQFGTALVEQLLRHARQHQYKNHDVLRFPGSTNPEVFAWKQQLKGLGALLKRWPNAAATYGELGDRRSRELWVRLLSYWVLGASRVRMPLNTPTFWRHVEELETLHRGPEAPLTAPDGTQLPQYRVEVEGQVLTIWATALSVLNTFKLQQYAGQGLGRDARVGEGDTVIDAGAFCGDSALYFAALVGPTGRVVALEPNPSNIRLFEANCERNPELARRITVVPRAAWHTVGESLAFSMQGAGGSVGRAQQGAQEVRTTTIDALRAELELPRVDFIKLDIEGAEENALLGAQSTIAKDRPTLAVCIYHGLDQLLGLPPWLARQLRKERLAYSFFLNHFTIHREETVLFAVPDR